MGSKSIPNHSKHQAPAVVRCAGFCPVCYSSSVKVLTSVPYPRIWEGLRSLLGVSFGEEVVQRHSPSHETRLVECSECGLEFFDPAVPGDAEFYAELTSGKKGYYHNQEKWDFSKATSFLRSNSRLLDVGCGSGQFLATLPDIGVWGVGIDENPVAVKKAQQRGLNVFRVGLDTFSNEHQDEFDFVTAFQILEHLGDVQSFVKSAVRCLRPGGKLIVSVPNRDRAVRASFEPLDFPPHHISRWSDSQFETLGSLVGCRVCRIEHELAGKSECRAVLRHRVSPRSPESVWARVVARVVFGDLLYRAFLERGLLERWRYWHHSSLCIFEKPVKSPI